MPCVVEGAVNSHIRARVEEAALVTSGVRNASNVVLALILTVEINPYSVTLGKIGLIEFEFGFRLGFTLAEMVAILVSRDSVLAVSPRLVVQGRKVRQIPDPYVLAGKW